MKQYVIIGNGVAAAGCIEGIRSVDTKSRIAVVSEENRPVYCRPLISYYLEGMTTAEKMMYRRDDFYAANGCDVIYGRKAVKLDPDAKKVYLDDGSEYPYDSVCIAAGSSPVIPPFAGIDTVKNKFTFMTLDDALALENALAPNSKVLIVGAGLIGLKCAEGISGRVASITICDLAPRILSSILDDECAHMMQEAMERRNISFMLSDTAVKFDKNKAYMKSGKEIDFDILILAVGVKANTSLIKDAGGAVNRGIITNSRMMTSIPGVYAAGDCTEGFDFSFGSTRILAILPNAVMGGRCAGANMAGGHETFENAIPMNSIGFFGIHAMTAGSYFAEADGGEMYEEKNGCGIRRLFTKDGYLTGFIIIGDVEPAGIYVNLIRNRIPLSEIDFDLVKRSPSLAAFSDKYRNEKLGSVV
ncbi:MAG TPA: NAD(P)/FAD-dependent oxidoreductase [Candidatus Alectryocaccobium stercorigallinarum]|nr:NAD(P)/FAD-dependent oxidoreductase [Candidatus Alectryocaccobium stercorigallinarum]